MEIELSPRACWRMFGHMPDLCKPPELAGAFLHAASNGWLPNHLSADKALSADDPHANDKLRARRALIELLHQPGDLSRERLFLVLEAVPDRWIGRVGEQLLRRYGQSVSDALSAEDRERYYRIWDRILPQRRKR